MGWRGTIRATGTSTDVDFSKRNGAVRVAEGVGGRIEGNPLIELTDTCYEPELMHGRSLVLGRL